MKKILAILIMVISIPSFSSDSVDSYDGAWLGVFGKKALPNDYFLWQEVQLRYRLDSSGMIQTLYRLGLLKKLNDKHEVGLIYGFVQTGALKEHRPTLQHVQQLGSIASMKFSARSRLEARFLEDSPDDAARFRYMLRGQQALTPEVSLVVWEEPFINLTNDDWTGNRTFERNRAFLGARIPLADLNLEVGYLNQFTPRKTDIMEHIMVVYLFY